MSTRAGLLVLAVMTMGGTLACGSTAEPAPVNAAASGHAAIAKLRFRDRTVTLFGGPDGLRARVERADGTLVAADVPLEDLRSIDPIAYEVCRSAVASNGGEYLDARLGD
jgi:hypothetical protein